MRAVIYCRLSENPEARTISLEAQEADGRSVAEQLGADVVRVITDDDITAADPDVRRPGFEEMLEGVLAGDWDLIVAVDQLRLLRRIDEVERVIGVCAVSGARVHYTTQGASDLESPEGKFLARLNALLGTYEIEKIKVRVRRNMAERARRGLPLSGRAGFGFRKMAGADNYEIVDGEADEIRKAAERVVAGDALAAIAADWNARGMVTRSGRPWRAGGVRRVLLAPRTAGLRAHRGKVVGEAAWPAIVDETTWRQVARVLSAPERRTVVNRDAHLLTGIATCGHCKQTLNHSRAHNHPGTDGAGIYFCRHCRRISIRSAELDALAGRLIVEHVAGEDVAASSAGDGAAEAGRIRAALEAVADREAELAEMWGDGQLSRSEWETARGRLRARRREIEQELVHVEVPAVLAEFGADVAGNWDAATPAEKRAVARYLFEVFEVGAAKRGRVQFDETRVTWRMAKRVGARRR